jgi:hypothetical protein
MSSRRLKDDTALLIRMRRLLAQRLDESQALLANREAVGALPAHARSTLAVLPLRVRGSEAPPIGAVGTLVPMIAGERAA